MQGMRSFQVHQGLDGAGDIRTATRYIRIPKAADVATRVNAVMPGRFLVQAAAGNNNVGDGASAADTTGTPGRLIFGLVMVVCDAMGRRKDRQILAPTEEGIAIVVPTRVAMFAGLEDGVGGGIADAGGFASIVLGTTSGEMANETNFYTPFSNDEIDSSTIASGTAANRALRIISPLGDITNTNTARRVWKFTITDAFAAQVF